MIDVNKWQDWLWGHAQEFEKNFTYRKQTEKLKLKIAIIAPK